MRNRKLYISLAYSLLSAACCFSQSNILKYARTVVDTLASPSMHGRGYVLKGDSIAADYIKNEFQKFGLKPIRWEFYQKFSFSVNTFPENITIKTKSRTLVAGRDFIPKENSPSCNGKYPIEWIDKTTITNKKNRKRFINELYNHSYKNKALFVDTTGAAKALSMDIYQLAFESNPAVLFHIADNKLTNDVSTALSKTPQVVVMRNAISKNEKYIEIFLASQYVENYVSKNILGYIQGTQYPDSFIVFTAHYDHLGRMGKEVYFPGANDNASGCAMLLSLAKYYSEHKPKYSVAFMAFGAEEAGILGSKYFVEHPLFPLKQIKFLINFDIVGTGDEGIKVVNATEHKKEFEELVALNKRKNYLSSVQPRGKAAISDHHSFEEAGVKTFFIYTLGGTKAYHDIYDRAETLPLTKFEDLYKLLIDFSNSLQALSPP